MQISEDRVSHLAHKVIDKLWRSDQVDFPDEPRALLQVKNSIAAFFAADEEIDLAVRKNFPAAGSGRSCTGSSTRRRLQRGDDFFPGLQAFAALVAAVSGRLFKFAGYLHLTGLQRCH